MLTHIDESLSEAERVIEGQARAEQLLRGLKRTVPRGDELFKALAAISEEGDASTLKGFTRTLQKALEKHI
jgi:hypothetical protein